MSRILASILICATGSLCLADDPPKVPPVKEPELRTELIRRTKADQEARNALIKWMNESGTNGTVTKGSLSKEKQA